MRWKLMQKLALNNQDSDPDIETEPDVEETPDDVDGGAPSIPVSVIPEALRGKPVEEIQAAIAAAFQNNSGTAELRRELNELKDSLRKPAEPAKPSEPEKPLEELLYENPEEAIARVIERRFGGRFAGLEQRVGSTEFATIKGQFADFDEHEEDVKNLLKQSGAAPTSDNILGAYQMVLGRKTMEDRMQKGRKRANPERPKPDKDLKPKAQMSQLEKDIARGMGMSEEDYITGRDTEDFNIKVPT